MAFPLKSEFIISLALILSTWAWRTMSVRTLHGSTVAIQHEQWMAQYGRTYKDLEEKERRREIFERNLQFIEDFNASGNRTFKVGINQFSDLTDDEFVRSHTGYLASKQPKSPKTASLSHQYPTGDVPDSIDCDSTEAAQQAAQIKEFVDVQPGEEELQKAVAQQPVSVGIAAGGQEFRSYSGGVFNGYCGEELDHAVAVVGYGTSEDGTNFWKIRNSWGESWGEEGYMRIQRGVDSSKGMCGLASQASYPVE